MLINQLVDKRKIELPLEEFDELTSRLRLTAIRLRVESYLNDNKTDNNRNLSYGDSQSYGLYGLFESYTKNELLKSKERALKVAINEYLNCV